MSLDREYAIQKIIELAEQVEEQSDELIETQIARGIQMQAKQLSGEMYD
jgi:hypothetical protein